MALLETIDRVSDALDKTRTTVGVFIDLSKAFDTVAHTILLNKLYYYGIKGLAIEWFKNYLSDRLQYVKIRGVSSHMLPITCGYRKVPYWALYYFSSMSMICLCVLNFKMHSICR